jgi:hypothetical protein
MRVVDAESSADRERNRRVIFDTVAVRALAQVLELAKGVGARTAPVKGVVLSRWLYEHPFDRPYVDVDLLIARPSFLAMRDAVVTRGWRIDQFSGEMGQLEFSVDRVAVEVHGEFGRRDLSRLSTEEVLARATPDRTTFPFEILRLDDVDHFLLLVANATKKAFTYANPHQPTDLDLLLARLEPRWTELIARAESARFVTAVRNTSEWMIEEHGSKPFQRFWRSLPRPPRRTQPAAIRLYRRRARRLPKRLESASGLVGLALAILTPDDRKLRLRGLARLIRRGVYRRLGRHPG